MYGTNDPASRSVVTGDVNNDNRVDIIMTEKYENSFKVLFGYGNGSFGTQVRFSTGFYTGPRGVVAIDFNGDHNLDIIVANTDAGNIGVFLGYGNGSFAEQMTFFMGIGSFPISMAVGDLNEDNYVDIVVANTGNNELSVILNYGNGSFAAPTMFSTGADNHPYSPVIADLNNDNYLDVVIAN